MRALYEIDNEILECVDEETGEILDEEKLNALEMEREKKSNDETYAKVLSDIQKDVTDTLEKYKNLNIKD